MSPTAMQMIADAKGQVGSVEAKTAADELASGAAVLVDVREPEEWQHGHIDGSVPAPRGLLEFFADPTSPATRRRSIPQSASLCCAPPVPVHRSQPSRSRTWVMWTPSSSRAASRAGQTPDCQQPSTSTPESEHDKSHPGRCPSGDDLIDHWRPKGSTHDKE